MEWNNTQHATLYNNEDPYHHARNRTYRIGFGRTTR